MPIIKSGNGYIYKNRAKRTKHKKWLFVFFLFVCSACAIFGSFFAFSLVDVTSALSLNKYLVFEEKIYFAVSVESSDSHFEASKNASTLKLQDGAGYVLKKNEKFFLIVGVYSTRDDAQKVLEKLNSNNASIVEICLEKLIISSSYNSQQIEALKSALSLVDDAYSSLSEIVISLDRAEILDAEARQKLKLFEETCRLRKESFSKAFQNDYQNLITRVKIFLSETISNISTLSISQNLSSDIKYQTVSILSSFLSLEQNVKK